MASDMFDEGRSEASQARKEARMERRASRKSNFGESLARGAADVAGKLRTKAKKVKKTFVTRPSAGGTKREPSGGLGPSARGIAASMGKAGGQGRYGNQRDRAVNEMAQNYGRGRGRPFEMPQIGDQPTGFTGMPKGWSPWGAQGRLDTAEQMGYNPQQKLQDLLRRRGQPNRGGIFGAMGSAVGTLGGGNPIRGFGNTMFGGRGNAPDQYGGGQRPPSMMMNRTQAIPSMMMNRGMGTPGPGMSGNMMNRSQFTPAPNRMGRMY